MHKTTGVAQLLTEWSKGNQTLFDELNILLFEELRIAARRCLSCDSQVCVPSKETLAGRVFENLFPNLAFSTKRGYYVFLGKLLRDTVHTLGRRPMQESPPVCWRHLGSVIEQDSLTTEQIQVATLCGFGGFSKGEVASMLHLDEITVTRLWDEVRRTPILI